MSTAAAPTASRQDPRDHRDRARQAREVPRRAHHDVARRRRQGDRGADRGPARRRPSPRRARRARRRRRWSTIAGAELAMTTDSFVVKPIRFPGGSIGELAVNGTVNDLAMAGARPVALSLVADPRGGARRPTSCAAEVEAIAAAAAAAGVAIVAGDTKVVERGAADGMYICTTGVGRGRRARAALARRAAPRRPVLVSGRDRRARHGDHARARRVRARRRRSSPTRGRCGRSSTRCWTPPAPACAACATRRAAASPRCSTSWRAPPAWRCSCARPRCRCRRPSPARRRSSGSTRCTSPTRACSWRSSRRSTRTRRSPRCAPCRGGEQAAEIGEVQDRAPRDGARGDGVRRQAGHGSARGRPAAAHLLRGAADGDDEFAPNQAATEEITAHVLWMTSGLSCEGDSVAMTSATNPSLEDIITGAIPGMPKVVVHNQVLAYEIGEEYIQAWYDAEAGKLDPFVLIIEGSLGNEKINGDGHWTGFGVNPPDGQPITTNEWVDRLAPQGRGGGRDRHLRHLRRHPGDEEQPDRRHGRARLPRAGTGSPRPASRSSTSRAAPRSRTT